MIYLIGILFDFSGMTYYQTNKDVNVGDYVVCQTEHGTFLGQIRRIREASSEDMAKPNFATLFPPIERIATFQDKAFLEESKIRESRIVRQTQQTADSLRLDMKVLSAHLDVDDNKVLITFTSDNRVDFRELVKILNGILRLRIELRQIGPRDQAKIVGGIGPCGLPLCCSTFLSTFDGISISMAKNQLLSINIPKLSGQCGKLMCCLKFEDDTYSKLRPLYPKIGEKFTYRDSQYSVTGLNLLSDTITAYNGENYESFSREEFEKVKKGILKVKEQKVSLDINSGIDLSGHGLSDTNRRIDQIRKSEEKHQEELKASQQNRRGSSNNSSHGRNAGSNNSRPNSNRPNGNSSRPNSSRPNGNNNRPGNRPNNQHSRTNNNHSYSHNAQQKKDSGFIPVSQIADKSVLDVRPVKTRNDKK